MDHSQCFELLWNSIDKKKLESVFDIHFDNFWNRFKFQLETNKYDVKKIKYFRDAYHSVLHGNVTNDIVSDFHDYIYELLLEKSSILAITDIKRSISFTSFKGGCKKIKQPLKDNELKKILKWIVNIYNREMIGIIILSNFYLLDGVVDINEMQTQKRRNQIGNRKLKPNDPMKIIYDEIQNLNKQGFTVYNACRQMVRKYPDKIEGADIDDKFRILYKRTLGHFNRNNIQIKHHKEK